MSAAGPVFDRERFHRACETVARLQRQSGFRENITPGKSRKSRARAVSREGLSNIGGLCESSLHLILKYFIEENSDFHEVGYGAYSLDVYARGTAYEIQTGNFGALRNKLKKILAEHPVRVVFPIAATKRIIWTNPDTGEQTGFRKSPKKETPLALLSQLVYLLPLVSCQRLSFCTVLLSCDEYRLLCGWSRDGKRGSVRYNRVPTELHGVFHYSCADDFLKGYLPFLERGTILTSARLTDTTILDANEARIALKLLCALGYIRRSGKEGRFFRYEVSEDYEGRAREQ